VAHIREAVAFPGIEMILRVALEVSAAGVTTGHGARHPISGLKADEASPKRLMGWVRGHWSVENGLHFVKDRWWDEDRQWGIRPGLAERLAMPRDSALTGLRLVPGCPKTCRSGRGRIIWGGRSARPSSSSGQSISDFAILLAQTFHPFPDALAVD
jgi:hypothetical protein